MSFRLGAYESVIRARMAEQSRRDGGTSGQPSQARRVIPATRAALQSAEAFKGIFSFG